MFVSLLLACAQVPPAVPVRIGPEAPDTTDDLVVEAPAGMGVLHWFRDDEPVVALRGDTVPADLTARGQTWRVRVEGPDGATGEASVVIGDAPPVVRGIAWSEPAPGTDAALEVRVEADDPDGDPVTLRYAWTVDGAAVDEAGPVLDGTRWFDAGDRVAVRVTATDGFEAAPPVELGPLVVRNTPPGPPVLAVDVPDPLAGMQDLTCLVVEPPDDPDGTAVGVRLDWSSEDGRAVEGAVLPAAQARAGRWTCRGVPFDGQDEGEAATVAVEVRRPTVLDFDAAESWPVVVEPPDAGPGETVTVAYTGELAGADAVTLRYGFDGWVALDGVDGLTEEESTYGLTVAWAELPLTRDGDAWRGTLALPDDARALHMRFTDGEAVDDDDGRGYHHALRYPFLGPYLTWDDRVRPGTGVVVSFETDVPCHGVVSFGTGRGPDRWAAGDEVDTLHHVVLDDLEPDTTYTYRLHDPSGRVSEAFRFHTPPAGGDALRFLVMGDAQDDAEDTDRWPEVAAAALQEAGDAAAVLFVGDMAANDLPGWWWRFFAGGRDLFASVPILPVIGNHDTPGRASSTDWSSFERYFAVPAGSGMAPVYVVDLGPARFIALASEDPDAFAAGGDQYDWLDGVLAETWDGEARVADWVFAAWHHPPYDAGARFAGSQGDTRPITALLEGTVDWVFNGHEHIYQRFGPIRYEALPAPALGIGPEDGVGYLVAPSAGDMVWEALVDPDSEDADARPLLAWPELDDGAISTDVEHGFVVVDLDGDALRVRTWGMGDGEDPLDPALVDDFSYTR